MSRSRQPPDLKKRNNIEKMRTVKVSNISKFTCERDIKELFSFYGEILYVKMQRESENTQVVFVTYKDSQGADIEILLTYVPRIAFRNDNGPFKLRKSSRMSMGCCFKNYFVKLTMRLYEVLILEKT
uniref:RRM domain-containing protein n=1 Tax=Cucumis melo TaxID=3656 RepID=A0A9I9E8I3_CUCME